MESDNCNVCGFSEMRLIDGYQYCVECGTQNENFRETVIEQTFTQDGTAMYTQVKKIRLQVDDHEMNTEWIKWHTFNFILCGLTEDLIKFGAKPSLKKTVMWIWSRYIQKYKETEEKCDDKFGQLPSKKEKTLVPHIQKVSEKDETTSNDFTWQLNEEQCQKLNEDSEDEWQPDTDEFSSDSDDKEIDLGQVSEQEEDMKFEPEKHSISITTLLNILFLACNFNGEDIQVSDIYRFIHERRLPYFDCVQRYVPPDLDYRKIPDWYNFCCSLKNFPRGGKIARKATLQLCSELKLGSCITPNICKLIDRYLNELQLPDDLKLHISVLLRLVPYERLLIRTTLMYFYEGIALSYIIVALKILFVLDDEYEYKLSAAAQTVNEKLQFPKVFTTSIFMTSSDRLFTWTEWVQYIEFRKIYIAEHFSPIAKHLYGIEISDHLLTSVHNKHGISTSVKTDYADEIIMENLSRFSDSKKNNIPEETVFPTSLTPMQTYTKVLMEKGELTDVKDTILAENFNSYSLEYLTPVGKSEMCQEINMDINTLIPSVENKEVIPKTPRRQPEIKFDPGPVYVVNCPESFDWVNKNCIPQEEDWITLVRDGNKPIEIKEESLDCEDPYPLVEGDLPEPDPILDESESEIDEPLDMPDNTIQDGFDDNIQDGFDDTIQDTLQTREEDEKVRQELIDHMLKAVMKKYRIYSNPLNQSDPPRVLRKRKAKECNIMEEEKIPTKRVREVGALSVRQQIDMIILKYLAKVASEEVINANENNLEPLPELGNEVKKKNELKLEAPIPESDLSKDNAETEIKEDDLGSEIQNDNLCDEQDNLCDGQDNLVTETKGTMKVESFRDTAKRTAYLVDTIFTKDVEKDDDLPPHPYWLGHHHKSSSMPDKKFFSNSFYWLLMECCALVDCKQPAELYSEVRKLEMHLTLACK